MNDIKIKHFRDSIDFGPKDSIYMNHAAISPTPRAVFEAMKQDIDIRHFTDTENLDDLLFKMDDIRSRLTIWLDINDKNRIGFIYNVSTAINQVLNSMTWEKGDKIIVNPFEFPSNYMPYVALQKKGVEIIAIGDEFGRWETSDLMPYSNQNIRLVAVSAVQFLSGFSANLNEIGKWCKDNDSIFLVDAIQGVSNVPISVQQSQIDILVSGSHKWLMGPTGIGYLFVSENAENQLDEFPMGWLNYEEAFKFFQENPKFLKGGRLFELGGISSVLVNGMHAAIKEFDSIGISTILESNKSIAKYFDEHIKELDLPFINHQVSRISNIRSIPAGDKADAIYEDLKQKHIFVAKRNDTIRFSPHFYNTESDIEFALSSLKSMI